MCLVGPDEPHCLIVVVQLRTSGAAELFTHQAKNDININMRGLIKIVYNTYQLDKKVFLKVSWLSVLIHHDVSFRVLLKVAFEKIKG